MPDRAWRIAVDSGASGFVAWLRRRQATILTYHALIATEPPPELRPLYRLFVTAEDFRTQMLLLRERYHVVPLTDLVKRLAAGESVERLAAVTFDDGWRSTRTLAAPILVELGLPATVFIASGLMESGRRGLWTQQVWSSLLAFGGSRLALGNATFPAATPAQRNSAIRRIVNRIKSLPATDRATAVRELRDRYGAGPLGEEMEFMSWREVRELGALGIDAGAHTVDHEILSRLSADEAARQIVESRREIERETGESCRLFAYPNGADGDFTDLHAHQLEKAGFLAAMTQIPGRNDAASPRFKLRRINIGLDHTRASFLAHLDGLRHWG